MSRTKDIEFERHEILHTANSFYKLIELASKNELSDELIALEINICFACELYMKYIYYFIDNNKTETPIHKLKDLYDKLGVDSKGKIKNSMDAPDNFEDALSKISDNFCALRYQHEYSEICSSSGFAYELVIKLRAICQEFEKQRLSKLI